MDLLFISLLCLLLCHKQLAALILRVCASCVKLKMIHKQVEDTDHLDREQPTSLMVRTRMETTHGPTYSGIVIGAQGCS